MPAIENSPSLAPPLVAQPAAELSWPSRAIAYVTIAFLAIVPLIFSPGMDDRMVISKETAFRAHAILAAFLAVVAIAFGATARMRAMARQRTLLIAIGAAFVWTLLAAALSTNRMLSMHSLVPVTCSLLLFLAVWYAAPRTPLIALDILVPVVIANTVLVTLQEYEIWQPFAMPELVQRHLTATGFIGNPNVVGSYLALAAIILGVAAYALRGLRRWIYVLGMLVAIGGVLVSQTRTAFIVVVAGAALWARAWSFKRAVTILVLAAVLIGAAAALELPILQTLRAVPSQLAAGQWSAAFSERTSAYFAAIEMFRSRPLTGVGPGTYGFQYMPYRVRAQERYPGVAEGSGTNFGDAHNDHLQFLAEVGLPGYVAIVAIGLLLALGVLRRPREAASTPRHRVARALVIPLLGGVAVLCLAQFPFQIAVTRHLIVTMAALIAGWSES
ncbi:MAG: O-antigen ligase family protein [Acidobacteriota bacterium]|nr:O-antigen ligase family protein [Acidobacteriota bacterium]